MLRKHRIKPIFAGLWNDDAHGLPVCESPLRRARGVCHSDKHGITMVMGSDGNRSSPGPRMSLAASPSLR